MSDRYHCARCGDDMPARFERSHEIICALFSRVEAEQVERLLDDLEMN